MTGDAQLVETSRVGSVIYEYSCRCKGCERKGVTGDANMRYERLADVILVYNKPHIQWENASSYYTDTICI